jgi:hypothetical protein
VVIGKSISKERPLKDDSLLETSILSAKSRDLAGFSSTTNKGFAGIFGHSSMADYSSNIHKIKNKQIIDGNFGIAAT